MNNAYWVPPPEPMQVYSHGQSYPQEVMSRQTPPNPPMNLRSVGNAGARIVKPRSANNSPRDAMGVARRRSVVSENASRRRLAMLEQQVMAGSAMRANPPAPSKSSRHSWHPSTRLVPHPYVQPMQYTPTTQYYGGYPMLDTSPSSAIHSSYNSPVSAISPLSLPYTEYDPSDPPLFAPTSTSTYFPATQYIPTTMSTTVSTTTPVSDSILGAHYDWNTFVANGFNMTDPPTPNNLMPVQHLGPALTTDEAIPYQSLAVEGDTSEELVGLGLYDVPKRLGESALDPYNTLMTPQLLGSICRPVEPTGKGLKLEETWAPPTEDDQGR